MPIDLGTVAYRSATPRYIDFGGELTPPLGGEVQRINRLGNRFALDVELPPLREGEEGRELPAQLRLAKQQGAIMDWPQPGLDVGNPGSPLVDGAVSGGTSLPIKGLTALYPIKFGQFFSIVHAGRRYVHAAAAAATGNAGGSVTLTIDPMLRVSLSNNDVIEMLTPRIEGLIDFDGWTILKEPFVTTGFTIREAA